MEIDEVKLRTLVTPGKTEGGKRRAAARFEKLKKVAGMLYQGHGGSEIENLCRVTQRDIRVVRRTLNIVVTCECGLPATHTIMCEYRKRRYTTMNPDAVKCESGFASARCKRFLEKHPEVKAAVDHFQKNGHGDFQEAADPLLKLSRFGSLTERQMTILLRAYEVAHGRLSESESGRPSKHVGIEGQRLFRLMVQVSVIERLGHRHFRIEAIDEASNVLTWWTATARDYPDGWFPIDCTVGEHARVNGRDETVLRYCMVRPMEEDAGPFKDIVAELERIEGELDADSEAWERLQLARAALGDTKAFDALAIKMRGQMLNTATWFLGRTEADDVVQLALIRAWTYARLFRFHCPVWAWFLVTTRRTAITELQIIRRRREFSLEEKMEGQSDDSVPWEPVSPELPPYGGLFIREAQAQSQGLN